MSLRPSCVVLFGLLIAAPATAGPISLDSALESASELSPELMAGSARLEQALGGRQTARYLLPGNPEIEGGVEGSLPLAGGQDWSWGIGLALPLEAPGQRPHRVKAADAAWRAASADLELARLTLRAEITQLYFELMFQERRAAVLLGLAEQAERIETGVHTKLQSGGVSVAGHALLLADSAGLRAQAAGSRADLSAARLRLGGRLGLPPGDAVETQGGFPQLLPAAPLATLLSRGSDGPELTAAALRLEQSERALRLQRALVLPDLALRFGFRSEQSSFDEANFAPGTLADPSDNSQSIGIGLTMPMPLARTGRGEITAARGTQREAEANLAAQRRSVSIGVGASHAAYEGARERVVLLVPASGDVAQVTALYEAAWAAGQLGLADYLAFRDRAVQTSLAALEAQRDGAFSAAALELAVAGSYLEEIP